MRALIVLLLAGCSTRVVDLGKQGPDAAIDASPTATTCRCRLPCNTATGTGCEAIGSTCGVDGYCSAAVGACSPTTPQPCNPSYPTSTCIRPSSTVLCAF